MKIVDRFKALLERKGASQSYEQYFLLFDTTERTLEMYLHQTPSEYFISAAFNWDKTEEGFKYWAAIHNGWQEILFNKQQHGKEKILT